MPDPRELFHNPEEAIHSWLDGLKSGLWTAVPAIVTHYDAQKNTVAVSPGVSGYTVDELGNRTHQALPDLPECPVVFPRDGGFVITFPIQKGDECLVVFSTRSIDEFWQTGKAQAHHDHRTHDLSDGMAIFGLASLAHPVKGVSGSGMQLKAEDGSAIITLEKGKVSIKAAHVKIEGETHIRGDITVEGKVTASGDVKAGSISLQNHVHGGVETGSGTTAQPE
ncbi:Gp138 family membrane-puncturing spike protein [Entomobacter blattae]|uniref:Phage protein Gp138 N-terminal domain-containing protein n=1 Tax=Entomobacter blattae TaxID=2762277 RepID=A0A7H1NTS4_9PROT|nr:Gp138 family membrane-puncturing spike protein [Entomobacter blattae]QNT79184.1 hypothetical protein JGUZn3_19790 [Entomobacter blattae]